MGSRIWKGHIRKEELLARRVLRGGKHSFSRARGGILLLAIGEKQDRKAGNRQPNQGHEVICDWGETVVFVIGEYHEEACYKLSSSSLLR